MSEHNSTIVKRFEEAARAAVANAQATREKAQAAIGVDGRTDEHADAERMFAEGILCHYVERSINEDGTLVRELDESDDDMVKHLRRGRRNLIKRLLFTPEQQREGIAGLQQHYRREGAKRFLGETTFVRVEGEL
ncbi:hypothetical protein [Streptomyces sp. MH60]|uniref:hypothetical protein n=1 Tax=Streptomyces sp. MH60 TaxID=1940758 RepID=UPI000CEF1656|nr:hypothetical protein [Streptomyces sp. MH60]PPS89587.1 hypothetical protein BZZ08_01734 [Streptomyces sp. MH60]